MDPEATDEVSRLFQQAADLEPAARAAFLDRACAGDTRLRDEVLSLLGHADHCPPYLQTGAFARRLPAPSYEIGKRIGSYRIAGVLGEGGMGIVLRAEQLEPIRREVAIKVVRLEAATREVVDRFASELRALAALSHPHIAHVHDAGTTDEGLPYLVMELVPGEPITDYCTRKRLSVDERLALFRQVCNAIQHAHRKAVIHRDLKRSNVLVADVDGRPVAKVIDFGIAKLVGDSGSTEVALTEAGRLVGTPEYMSPEQATLGLKGLDARTDVYSLGVLLYELLVGSRPFDGDAPDLLELLRRIREDEPAKPSSRADREVTRRLRGDLDWITLKALEKDPERRYATPADLEADIERHLAGEAVAAGPPTASYRLRKLAARHRVAALSGAVFLVSLVGFSVFAGVQARRANAEAAEQELMTRFLLSLFEAPDVVTRGGPNVRGTLEVSLEQVRTGLEDRPVLRARLLHAMGYAYRGLGLEREAVEPLEEARSALSALVGPADPQTLAAAESLAEAFRAGSQYAEAEPLFLEALRVREATSGANEIDTLRTAGRLGQLYKDWGQYDLAERYLERASRGFDEKRGRQDAESLSLRGFLAGTYLELAKFAETERLLVELVEAMPAVLGEGAVELTVAYYNLASARAELGRSSEAMDGLRRAIERGFPYVGSILQDPHLGSLHEAPGFSELERQARLNTQATWNRATARAGQELLLGRYESAERLALRALEGVRRVRRSGNHQNLIAPMLTVADARLRRGAYDEAEQILLERLATVQGNPKIDRSHEAETYQYLAQAHIGRRDWARARQAVELSVPVTVLRDKFAYWAYSRAEIAALDGDRAEALRYLDLAADRGFNDADWLAFDLAFVPLHADPEFRRIETVVRKRQLFLD